jgi:RNA polymerase sigma factor (sigma-70 family)
MPLYKKLAANPAPPDQIAGRPLSLDERLVLQLQTPTPLDQIEAQEFRQAVMKALRQLNPEELRVMELRYQFKKSPGQAALQLSLTPAQLKRVERSALRKLRKHLAAYGAEP